MASGLLMFPEMALKQGGGCAAGLGHTPRNCIVENDIILEGHCRSLDPWGGDIRLQLLIPTSVSAEKQQVGIKVYNSQR